MSAASGPPASAPPERCSSLADGLIRCLAVLDDEPACFARAARSWHARLCLGAPQVTLAEAVSVRLAVEALGGPDAIPAACSLRALFDRHGSHDLASALARWLDGHGNAEWAVR